VEVVLDVDKLSINNMMILALKIKSNIQSITVKVPGLGYQQPTISQGAKSGPHWWRYAAHRNR
jgi:hypothetical protein